MGFPVGYRLLLPAALVLVALAAAAPAAAAGKKVTCKGSKVAVTVGKKKTCRPFAKVFPPPKAIDPRLAHLQQVLRFDPAKAVPGKKRKRVRTLQSGFGAVGKRAQKKLLKMLPKALALIDRKRGARSSRLRPGTASASGGCAAGPASPTGQTGGATVGALGDNGGFVDAPVGGGLRVRVTFVSCGGVNAFSIPECPTANGSVDATGSGEFRATVEIRNGDQVVSRNSSTFEEKAKVHGQVGADAKLKFLEVEHTQEVFIVASGGIVIRGGVTRKARIDMPAGQYAPADASIRFFGDQIASDSGASAFASTAEAAIRRYRAAEGRWSTFNPGGSYCAEPVFSPESNTLKLRKGDSKQLGIYAKARSDGGRASEARWTLLNQENAAFSPAASQEAAPTVAYTVTQAPENGFVKVTARFTSTAGVGEKTWTQPTEKGPAVNQIAGTFSQRTVQHFPTYGDSILEFSGNVVFERFTPSLFGGVDGLFKRKEGTMTASVSGNGAMFVSAPLCSQRGSLQLALVPESTIWVNGTGAEQREPYEYSFSIASDSNPEPPKLNLEIYACDEVAEEQEGFYEIPVSFEMSSDGAYLSPDGIDYSGSDSEASSGVTVTEAWSFQGTE